MVVMRSVARKAQDNDVVRIGRDKRLTESVAYPLQCVASASTISWASMSGSESENSAQSAVASRRAPVNSRILGSVYLFMPMNAAQIAIPP